MQHHLQRLSQLWQFPVPLQFPLPDLVIPTDALPHHWVFYLQGSVVPIYYCCTWSGSMCKVYIALQDIQAVAFKLHEISFQLSSKVVALHLGSSTAKAYSCDQGSTAPLLSCLTSLLHFASDGRHAITLIPAYIPSHLNVEAISFREGWFPSATCFLTKFGLHFILCFNQR